MRMNQEGIQVKAITKANQKKVVQDQERKVKKRVNQPLKIKIIKKILELHPQTKK
jgi:hypothetical protein